MIAINLIRQQPHYRREAFDAGMRRAGYRLVNDARPAGPEDLLIIWNRYDQFDVRATAWEAAGGTVLVAENGYLGADDQGRQHYALSAHGHNGSGYGPQFIGRFAKLGIQSQPWKTDGESILVRGQRGIGTKEMASPANWHVNAGRLLKQRQALPVVVREHPGRHEPRPPIAEDLGRAAGCVIWCSSVGVKALIAGVPVWYDAPHWICEQAGRRLADDPHLANPLRDDGLRMAALERMASLQWSVAELESGEPFVRFRDAIAARQREAA